MLNKLYFYTFSNEPELIHIEDTVENNSRVLEICQTESQNLCAALTKTKGHVQLFNLSGSTKAFITITAHNSDITIVRFSHDGHFLATASEKGTLIRVYELALPNSPNQKTAQKWEFRRGTEHALIYDIAFSPNNKYLGCSSETGTVHVFKLESETQFVQSPVKALIKKEIAQTCIPKYLRSKWSFSQAKLQPKVKNRISFDEETSNLFGKNLFIMLPIMYIILK